MTTSSCSTRSWAAPHHHQVDGFQTKSFDNPSVDTYLFKGPHVHLIGLAWCSCSRRRANLDLKAAMVRRSTLKQGEQVMAQA